jgi:hypothetical protein
VVTGGETTNEIYGKMRVKYGDTELQESRRMDQKYGRREGVDARFGRAIHGNEFKVTV